MAIPSREAIVCMVYGHATRTMREEITMQVGIGLPATIPGVDGRTVVDWARRADAAGFSSLGVIDRLVYPNYDPMTALAAAAAVTEHIRLMPTVVLAPLWANVALFAKQCLSLDRLSGGRFTLGVGLGARDDDFEASGLPTAGRGRRLDEQLDELKRIWSGERRGYAGPIGPPATKPGGPELIIGGAVPASFRRVAERGDGWIMGGGTPDQFATLASAVDEAWAAAGREGSPRKLSLAYFALGADAGRHAQSYLHDYYAWLGPIADAIASGAAVTAETVAAYVAAFRDAGCDELVFQPCSPDPGEVELLAEAAL
jgi:alkanesulfonate monooxygenase SsuD/methylene tetrahydromethanopterin reductase-like flavin-dependent oxidoreductase (luciferase family)